MSAVKSDGGAVGPEVVRFASINPEELFMRMATRPQRNWASVGRCVVVIALGGLVVSPIAGCGGGSGNGAGRGGSPSGSGGSVGGQSGSGGTTNTGGASGGGAFGGAGSSGGGGVAGTGGPSGAGGTSASGGAGSGGSGAGGTAGSGGRAGNGAAAGGGSGGASGNGGQAGSGGSSGSTGARLVQNFNQAWKFKRADVTGAEATTFDDASWDDVGLPHSFSLPYFMASKFYVGYGWYRKHFAVPSSWTGKRVALEFQAAFDQAEIYVNGTKVGAHLGGYNGFSIDVTSAIKAGDNVVAVRLNNKWNAQLPPLTGDHTFQGGLYRDVFVVVTDPLRIAWYGTWVTTPTLATNAGSSSTVAIKTEMATYALEAELVADTLPALEPAWPAMTWADTLGNMRVLDAWSVALASTGK